MADPLCPHCCARAVDPGAPLHALDPMCGPCWARVCLDAARDCGMVSPLAHAVAATALDAGEVGRGR